MPEPQRWKLCVELRVEELPATPYSGYPNNRLSVRDELEVGAPYPCPVVRQVTE